MKGARIRIRREKGRCEGRKGLKETNPLLLKKTRLLRRKNKVTGKQLGFTHISKILYEEGFKNSKGMPFGKKVLRQLVS